jgi:hypothetical protein
VWENAEKRFMLIVSVCFPATSYCAAFFAAATDSTITISPITLPFTVARSPQVCSPAFAFEPP